MRPASCFILILILSACTLSSNDQAMKTFKLSANEIQPIATGLGGCFATDHITVEGKKVGYMYREEPDRPDDSDWRFFSGEETQAYVSDPNNTMIYDVNTIANYDPAIIPYLDAPVGSKFGRVGDDFVPE